MTVKTGLTTLDGQEVYIDKVGRTHRKSFCAYCSSLEFSWEKRDCAVSQSWAKRLVREQNQFKDVNREIAEFQVCELESMFDSYETEEELDC